jgi:hypothetical protein
LEVLRLTEPWTENGVTWLNQPAATGPAVTTSSGPGYREWNVTGLVQSMYAGENYGFVVRDAELGTDIRQVFRSRERGTDAPQLVLTFE